jgi:Fe/S biogenesis protein NfuA
MTDTAEATDTTTPEVLEITPTALETVLGIRAEEEDPDGLALRIEITGTSGVDYIYDLAFDELSNATDDDTIIQAGEINVVIPNASIENLRGSVLDMPRTANEGGLIIRNPNRPDPLEGVDLDLDGSIADKVQQLLEQSVNPSLASHGGFATFVGVDDDNRVFVTLGGGCQGCSMSRMTITEGIDRAIREAIPEVVEVVDATDHSAGENPFYQ